MKNLIIVIFFTASIVDVFGQPNHIDMLMTKAQKASASKNYDSAIQYCNDALNIDSKGAKIFFNKGNAHLGKSMHVYETSKFKDKKATIANLNEAIYNYGKALELDPAYTTAYINRGLAYRSSGDFTRALQDFSKAKQLNQNNAELFREIGTTYFWKKKYNEAIENYTLAIRLKPDFAEAYQDRGEAYNAKEDYDTAIPDLTKAIQLKPAGSSYYSRAEAYLGKKDNNKAIGDFVNALKLEPANANAYLNLGFLYLNVQNFPEAISNYTKAIQLRPDEAAPYQNRGLAHRLKGDYDNAVADYVQCLQLAPTNEYAYFSMLPCLIRLNRFSEAESWYLKYQESGVKEMIDQKGWSFYKTYLDAATKWVTLNKYNEALQELKNSTKQYHEYVKVNQEAIAVQKTEYSDVLALMGYVLEKLKRDTEARNIYTQTLAVNPYQPEVRQYLNRLKSK